MLAKLVVAALFATAVLSDDPGQDTWTELKWDGEIADGTSKSISEGSVHRCRLQPNDSADMSPGLTGSKCTTNADCGSALCIKFKEEAPANSGNFVDTKKCACGNFERRFVHEQVTICTCRHSKDSKGTCLDVWRSSIMCKFACKNCFNCTEKNEVDCGDDKTCKWNPATNAIPANCTSALDNTICVFSAPDNAPADWTAETDCKADIRCRWASYRDSAGAQQTGCKPRTYVDIEQTGANKNCPVGTERLRDKYMSTQFGTFFDTCARKIIDNCRFYEWDGDSCVECDSGYSERTVQLERGNGRLKKRALCIQEDKQVDCAVFYENDGDKCKRCKEMYAWKLTSEGTTHEDKICEKDPLLISEETSTASVVAVDLRLVLGVFSLAILTTVFFTNGYYKSMWKGIIPAEPTYHGDVDVKIDRNPK